MTKAQEVLGKLASNYEGRVEMVQCDVGKRRQLEAAVEGADQVVYAVSGFSAPRGTSLQKVLRLANLKIGQLTGTFLDVRGPALCARMMNGAEDTAWIAEQKKLPKDQQLSRLVLLSSAAVTRPAWGDKKKAEFTEAAEIPIVKLNPFNVLGTKLRGEKRMRKTARQIQLPYTIVRSTGITSEHPDGNFVVASGDTLVGRISPKDLGVALATTLITPQAAGKTVEIATEVGIFGTQSLFARGTQTLLRPRGAKQRIADGFAKCPSDDSLRPSLWELVRDFGSQE